MKGLRGAIAVMVVVASAAAAWRLVLPRYPCNREKAIVDAAIMRTRNEGEDPGAIDAGKLAAACRECLERFPEDYELHSLLASMQEVLGDLDGAEVSYRKSIRLNERPETYAYLGILELTRGKLDEARANLYYGSLFNLAVAEAVSDPLRTELMEEVMARHRSLNGFQDLGLEDWRKRRQQRRGTLE